MQRTIKTSAGDIRITGLKRRQLKELKAAGIDIYKGDADPDIFLDGVLSLAVHPDDLGALEDLIAYEGNMLLSKVMDLTFMTEDQRKNFAWQWGSTLPENSIPAPAAEIPNSENNEAARS